MSDTTMTAEFYVQNINLTEEARQEAWNNHVASQTATPAADTPPQDTPADTPPVDTPPIDTPPVDTPSGSFDFSKFGVASEDELQSKLSRLPELEDAYNKYKSVEKDLVVLDQVKNPFANERIMQMNQFIKSTGISDEKIAVEVMGTTSEDLSKDPLKAMVINELLSNPQLASVGMEGVRQYVAQKNGVDLSMYGSEDYEVPIALKVDSIKAIQNIEDKRKDFANINNYFVDLQKQFEDSQRIISETRDKWNVATPAISQTVKAIEIDVPTGVDGLGNVKFTYAVSEADVQQVINQIKPMFETSEFSTENQEAMRQTVVNALRLAKQTEIIAEAVRQAEGKITERLVREKHNLKPVTEKPEDTPVEKVVSDAEKAFAQMYPQRR